jgi:hypothetical protein
VAPADGGPPAPPLAPHHRRRGCAAQQHGRGEDLVLQPLHADLLWLGEAGTGQGVGDVLQVRQNTPSMQLGRGASERCAVHRLRVAETHDGVLRDQARVGLQQVGNPLTAQPGEGVLGGVAVGPTPSASA